MTRPALLMHCQHSVGLGHLVRTLALADALTQRFRVTLLCGGEVPEALPVPNGVELVPMPPLTLGDEASLVSVTDGLPLDEALARRRALVLETFNRVQPRVLVIELFPFGRKKLADELLPLLQHARGLGKQAPVTLCSLRDILVRSRHDQQRHDERASLVANAFFDAVLVHADARLARLEDSFAPVTPLAVPVVYTGLVCRPPSQGTASRAGIVVSAGGGRAGEPLLRTAILAQAILHTRLGLPMTIVAGPFLGSDAFERLTAAAQSVEGIEITHAVPDLRPLLRGASVSVSQCGYNTALELVETGVPAVVVPYAEGREDEQVRRAQRLHELGLVDVLRPDGLSPVSLALAIEARIGRRPAQVELDLDGAAGTVRAIVDLVARRTPLGAAA